MDRRRGEGEGGEEERGRRQGGRQGKSRGKETRMRTRQIGLVDANRANESRVAIPRNRQRWRGWGHCRSGLTAQSTGKMSGVVVDEVRPPVSQKMARK